MINISTDGKYKNIDNILIFATRENGVPMTRDCGISIVQPGKNLEYGFHWQGMLSPAEDRFFTDTVIEAIDWEFINKLSFHCYDFFFIHSLNG